MKEMKLATLSPQDVITFARYYREEMNLYKGTGTSYEVLFTKLWEQVNALAVTYLGNTMILAGMPTGKSVLMLNQADTAVWESLKDTKIALEEGDATAKRLGNPEGLSAEQKTTIVESVEKIRLEDANDAIAKWLETKGAQRDLFNTYDKNDIIPNIVEELGVDYFTPVRNVIVSIVERSSLYTALQRIGKLMPILNTEERERFVRESICMYAKPIENWTGNREKDNHGKAIFVPLDGSTPQEVNKSLYLRELGAVNRFVPVSDKKNPNQKIAGICLHKAMPNKETWETDRAALLAKYLSQPDPAYSNA